jgi:hypothetical protein
MVPIFASGQSWPGFSYTDEEKAAMREQFSRFPNAMTRLYVFAFCIMAPITIALILIPVLVMAWVLTATEHAHGGPLPTLIFFAIFGATMAVGLAVMLPVGYYVSCLLYGRRSQPSPADSEFGRKLFFKYCRQVGRVGVIVGFGCLLLSLWPTTSANQVNVSSPRSLNLWQRSGVALAGMAIQIATLWYYYRKGRELEKNQ